jgi:hypothetical protein
MNTAEELAQISEVGNGDPDMEVTLVCFLFPQFTALSFGFLIYETETPVSMSYDCCKDSKRCRGDMLRVTCHLGRQDICVGAITYHLRGVKCMTS